jgi:hypothetical protein
MRLKIILLLAVIFLSCSCKKEKNTPTPTPPPVNAIVDIDGNIYHSVSIGTQIWMLENLRVCVGVQHKPILPLPIVYI